MAGTLSNKKTVRPQSFEEILYEEGKNTLYSAGPFPGWTVTNPDGGLAIALSIIPNYNPELHTIVRSKGTISWEGDVSAYLAGGNRSWFSTSGQYISTGPTKKGYVEFDAGTFPVPLSNMSLYTTGPGTGTCHGMFSYTIMCNDMDLEAENTVIWIGDSISAGTVNSDLIREDFYQHKVKKFLVERLNKRLRLATYAEGGMHSGNMSQAISAGTIKSSRPAVIFVQFGANDAGQSIGTTAYKANMRRLFRWKQYRHPFVPMFMINTTPFEDDVKELLNVSYRQALSQVVAEANDPLIKYIDMTDCFDRHGGLTIWATTDAPGGSVHPGTALAHQGMADRIITAITNSNII